MFKSYRANQLAVNSKRVNYDSGLTPLGHAIVTGNEKEMTRILNEYDDWKKMVKNLYLTPDEHYDDPKKYFTKLHKCNNEIFSRFLDLDPEIPDEYVIDYMKKCRGTDCKDNFVGLLRYLRNKGKQYDSQTLKSNIETIVSTSKNSWYSFHTIGTLNYYLTDLIKIDSHMINNMLSDETTCEQKIKILNKYVITSNTDFSEIDIIRCKCSEVMEYLLNKPKINESINSPDIKGRTPLFKMKSQLDLDLLDDPRYSERLRSIYELEKHSDINHIDYDNKSYKGYVLKADDHRRKIRNEFGGHY
ncbi:hypothetical protein QLL95_gp0380 [Cotonvirus japonicus]|uniref:Ankyrin repeat protein n=1 Tax=Cotonvirus japonicus TaxID=2811091 RepID=A0ABM7NU87_9VIRU|nr:hypothetical protein QLL95_gp0380 [Cotonvirus japonicus]BCS83743.1 hypothetical protein [Cotonvirus japonicus]